MLDQETIDVLDAARERKDLAERRAQKLNDEAADLDKQAERLHFEAEQKRATAHRIIDELQENPSKHDRH